MRPTLVIHAVRHGLAGVPARTERAAVSPEHLEYVDQYTAKASPRHVERNGSGAAADSRKHEGQLVQGGAAGRHVRIDRTVIGLSAAPLRMLLAKSEQDVAGGSAARVDNPVPVRGFRDGQSDLAHEPLHIAEPERRASHSETSRVPMRNAEHERRPSHSETSRVPMRNAEQERRTSQLEVSAARVLSLRAAKLQLLLEEPLTRPLGSMQTASSFSLDDEITLVQPWTSDTHTESLHAPLPAAAPHGVDSLPADDAVHDFHHQAHTRPSLPRGRANKSPQASNPNAWNTPQRTSGSIPACDTRDEDWHLPANPQPRPSAEPHVPYAADWHAQVRSPAASAAAWAAPVSSAAASAAAWRGAERGDNANPYSPANLRVRGASAADWSAPRRASSQTREALERGSRRVSGRLSSPNAPSRRSAVDAGVVDGWERLPSTPAARGTRFNFLRSGRREVWAWAAGLAACSMFLAYGLTLSMVPQDERESPADQRVLSDASASPGPKAARPPLTRAVSRAGDAHSDASNTTRTEATEAPDASLVDSVEHDIKAGSNSAWTKATQLPDARAVSRIDDSHSDAPNSARTRTTQLPDARAVSRIDDSHSDASNSAGTKATLPPVMKIVSLDSVPSDASSGARPKATRLTRRDAGEPCRPRVLGCFEQRPTQSH